MEKKDIKKNRRCRRVHSPHDSGLENEKQSYYEGIRTYFEEKARMKTRGLHTIRWVVDQAGIWAPVFSLFNTISNDKQNMTTLADVGCGTGEFLRKIARRYPQWKECIGIDFAADVVAKAQDVTQPSGKISYMKGDLRHLPFPARSFDVAVCVNVLHHLHRDDLSQALAELTRITNNYLVIEIRNKNTVYNLGYLPVVLTLFYRDLPISTTSLHGIHPLIALHGFQLLQVRGIVPFQWGCRSLVLLYKRK